jgi:hypothetical protein
MKFIYVLSWLLISPVWANQNYGAPSNAASDGSSETSRINKSPAGTTKEEAQEYRERAESLGGAPNAGVGTGTGTGAGSKIGNDIEDEERME